MQRLDPGSVLDSRRGDLTVVSSRHLAGTRYVVLFAEASDRTTAEALRDLELEAEALELPGTLWVHELVGATVYDADGTELGRIAAVEANPASDLLVLDTGGLIPIRFVTAHDTAAQRVEVDIPEGLLEL